MMLLLKTASVGVAMGPWVAILPWIPLILPNSDDIFKNSVSEQLSNGTVRTINSVSPFLLSISAICAIYRMVLL